MEVKGNIKGIAAHRLERLAALYDFSVARDEVSSLELLNAMSELTGEIGKEIAVYLSRGGRVLCVEVGDNRTVGLTDISRRHGRSRLSGVRLLHTHPGGNGRLSAMDISAASLLRLDLVLAVGVGESGEPVNFGLAWGVLGDTVPSSLFFSNMDYLPRLSFASTISEIEAAGGDDELIETDSGTTRAILVAITGKSTPELAKYSLDELEELAETAGVEVLDKVLQPKKMPDNATFVGKGKVDELRFAAQILQADSLIFDDELSPVQIRNLEMLTGKAIIDRSMLILDIFAGRAKSNEGKLQVELAQLRYMMPRLVGQGEVLSRLGGGIGTRGPGETKLEVDRRSIRKRINDLEERLTNVERTRELHRRRRRTEGTAQVSLVGYTNAGKSTLLNALTDAGVLAEDKLFATLDTTMRHIELPTGGEVLLSDTVGFIRKLPHHLVAAFRSTLEEVRESSVLLHVVDSSAEELGEQLLAVNNVLTDLKAGDKPTITVLNKIDKLEGSEALSGLMQHLPNPVAISAKEGIGLSSLLAKIAEMLPQTRVNLEVLLPYAEGRVLDFAHRECSILSEEYTDSGVRLSLVCDDSQRAVFVKYLLNEV